MILPVLQSFSLAGGTALALRLGHRISVDIDLFSPNAFNSENLAHSIQEHESLTQLRTMTNTLNAFTNGVKLDCLAYQYPQLEPIETIENIRLYSLRDIAGMKLSAIGGRGARKDFYDIVALLSVMSLPEMLQCFEQKYPNGDTFHTLRALSYFEDADKEDEILLSTTTPPNLQTWNSVKSTIEKKIRLL